MKPEAHASRQHPVSPDPVGRMSVLPSSDTPAPPGGLPNDSVFTFETLVDLAARIDPLVWLSSVSYHRHSILFYQLHWDVDAVPTVAKSVTLAWGDEEAGESGLPIPLLCIGEKKLDPTCGLLILGHREVRGEADVRKLLEHVNQCPAEEVVQEMDKAEMGNGQVLHNGTVGASAALPIISAEQARDILLLSQSLPRVETLSDPASMATPAAFSPVLRRQAPARSMATLNGYHLDDTPTGTPQPTFLAAGASFSRKRKPVECDVCHQIYSTKHSMLLHRQSQHEHLRHTCEYCDRSFSYKYDLYTHMTKAHPEVEGLGANCEVCGVLTHFAVLEGHQKKCGRKVVKQNGGG